MRGCDHDKVFSGAINLERRFQWICSRCGEMGWDETYLIDNVSADEFQRQRVNHGWPTMRLPPPPLVPTRTSVPPRSGQPYTGGAIFFTTVAAALALGGIPWGPLGSPVPLWISLVGSGLTLGMATVCYVCWKRGL